MHGLFELTLQRITVNSHLLTTLTSWTYWMSQFTVLGLALLWVYLRRHEHFAQVPEHDPARQRDRPHRLHRPPDGAAADVPAARVRGHDRELRINHGSGFIQLASNQFAAMPSLHSADALIVGVTLALIVKELVLQGAVAALAGLGVVLGDGDRQPLLARRRRRDRESRGLAAAILNAPRILRGRSRVSRTEAARSAASATTTRSASGALATRVDAAAGADARLAERPDRGRRDPVHRGLRARLLRVPQRVPLLLARRRASS